LWLTFTVAEAPQGDPAEKTSVPVWLFPFIVALKITVPLMFTIPVCPGARVTEIWEGLSLATLTVVFPLELATAKLMATVALLARVIEAGPVRVQALVGDGLGEGDGDGAGVGIGVGVGVASQCEP